MSFIFGFVKNKIKSCPLRAPWPEGGSGALSVCMTASTDRPRTSIVVFWPQYCITGVLTNGVLLLVNSIHQISKDFRYLLLLIGL